MKKDEFDSSGEEDDEADPNGEEDVLLGADEPDGNDCQDEGKDEDVAHLEGGFHVLFETSGFGDLFGDDPLIEVE